jgi:DNA-binding NarL/FixJ family response regulator
MNEPWLAAGLGDAKFVAARTAGRTMTPQDVLADIDHGSIPAAEGAYHGDRAGRGAIMGLTSREVEVLRLICGGLTNREIGDRLSLSERTAQTHVQNILRKLKVGTRAAAAAHAAKHGLAS